MTLSETVESPKCVPAIANVAKPVPTADIEFSQEGRAARMTKPSAELDELESELHSATHIPFWAWSPACVASKAKADPHWRKRTEDAQEKGHDVVSFHFGFVGANSVGEKTAPYLCMVDHVSGAVFAVLTSNAVGAYVIKDIILKSDGEPSRKSMARSDQSLYQPSSHIST